MTMTSPIICVRLARDDAKCSVSSRIISSDILLHVKARDPKMFKLLLQKLISSV